MRSFIILVAFSQACTALIQPNATQSTQPTNNWVYQGCYTDEGDRQLGGESFHSNLVTPAVCISFCESKGYEFAGVEYSNECFCGHQIRSKSFKKDEGECAMTCAGDAKAICGGPNRLSIYKSRAASVVTTNPGSSSWKYLSCYEDSVYGRTLRYQISVPANSVEACTSACKNAGYKYAGVEWSNECFCDNQILAGRLGGYSDCDMPCSGKLTEYCGGSQRLNIYEFAPPVSSSTTTTTNPKTSTTTWSSTTFATSTTSASSSTTTTTSSIPSSTTTTTSITPTTTSSSTTATTSTTSSTTTTTTTTTSQAPSPTAFRLRARVASNAVVNNQIVQYDAAHELSVGTFNLRILPTESGFVEGRFTIEPGTNRLRVAASYVVTRDGLQTTTLSNVVTAITCDVPVQGQPLKCITVPDFGTSVFAIFNGASSGVKIYFDMSYHPIFQGPIELIAEYIS